MLKNNYKINLLKIMNVWIDDVADRPNLFQHDS